MKRILIIEDEQDIFDLVTIILEVEDYEVCSLTELEEDKSKLRDCHADLVLLYLNLGKFHGKDICKFIKGEEQLKQTAVVLMSANKDIQTIKEEAGADAFICKPFDLDHFIDVIKTQIN